MDEAVPLHMPVPIPSVGEHMAAELDLVLEDAVEAFRTRIGQDRQRGDARDRRPAWLAFRAMFDRHGHDGFALGTAPLAGFAMFLAAHIALVDLDQAAQRVAPIPVSHRLADLVLHQPGGLIVDADFFA